MATTIRLRILRDGVSIGLSSKPLLGAAKRIPWPEWHDAAPDHAAAHRWLARLVADGEAQVQENTVVLTHDAAASIPATIAEVLAFPPIAAVSLRLAFEGHIGSAESHIKLRWNDANFRPISPAREGIFLNWGNESGRLSKPVYQLVEAIESFNATRGKPFDERVAFWLPAQNALARVTGETVKADGYTGSLTLYQAGAFALDVKETPAGPDFVPVLMGKSKATSLDDDAPAEEINSDQIIEASPHGVRDEDADSLLPRELDRKFVEQFSAGQITRDAYVLGRNTFLLVEPELKTALDVVRRKRHESKDARRAFLKNPRAALAATLGQDDADERAASLFIETTQYSERVTGLGVWDPPQLPWIVRKPQDWLPEGFSIQIGGRVVDITANRFEELRTQVEAANSEGRTEIDIDGETVPLSEIEATLAENAHKFKQPTAPEIPDAPPSRDDTETESDRLVLRIATNLEVIEYRSERSSRHVWIAEDFPAAKMGANAPKSHQSEGFRWLVESWQAGWPGVLLADDMGLGKTFQALAFLAWIRANHDGGGRLGSTRRGASPILVVGPTALLNNWVAEADLHLARGALGERVDAFGSGLRTLRRTASTETAPEDALDTDRLSEAGWILTTYETLAGNHRAFARVPYSVAVFDEMQKVKDPKTINTHAAKAVNANFVLGLTGTPIENRLEDLWCIVDRIAPGYLGDLKSFSGRYKEDDPQALKSLKSALDERQNGAPSLMLRRMKEDVLDCLPKKTITPYRVEMPTAQAAAYRDAVEAAQQGERTQGAMLKAIHALRGISLHPEGAPDAFAFENEAAARDWVMRSGRLAKALAILREIDAQGEKAIVFVEDLAIQRSFADAVATIFNLPRTPSIINGGVPGSKRKAIVDRFQEARHGFDVLVLSPKAAGIGLTITAANHVIHLSRWWNPAVEDQCNDRVFRIGQTKPVTIHLPMAIHPQYGDRSFDVKLNTLLERKRSLSRDMLAPPVTDGDVDALFGDTVGAA